MMNTMKNNKDDEYNYNNNNNNSDDNDLSGIIIYKKNSNYTHSFIILKCDSQTKYLNCQKQNIEEILNIKNLQLERINLSFNTISDIDFVISLNGIKKLDLSNNKIKEIDSICEFKSLEILEYLNICSNEIKYIPDSIMKCRNLKEFYFDKTAILTDEMRKFIQNKNIKT